jgi:hypothetical protein
MSEELEMTEGASGVDRRNFIKRTAVVGGMVWAAPVLQSLSSPAFAMTPCGQDISNLVFILQNGTLAFKYEAVGGSCTLEAGGNMDQVCKNQFPTYDADFRDADTPTADELLLVDVDCSNPCRWVIKVLSDDYKVLWAIVKAGSTCTLFSGPYDYGKDVTVYQAL